LSAHPLDPFYLQLEYGCNTKLKDVKDMASQIDRELILGGIVVGFVVKKTKTGRDFGIMTIEDYSGSFELRMFGQNFIDFNKYAVVGTPIMIKGAYQNRKYGEGVDFNIFSIQLLDDVKGTMLYNISINLPFEKVESATTGLISHYIEPYKREDKEKKLESGDLIFNLKDDESHRNVRLRSQDKILITKNLVDFLTEQGIGFEINK
jgi:DNA polymerase-3 subunit alpha